MGLIVQKYGGTSVGDVERIQAVAKRVHETALAGHSVIAVVSAMGKSTDVLVQLADGITSNPSRREMDMLLSTGEQVTIALLSMALHERGQAAISLTGAQVGIVTEAEHTRARILEIRTERLERHLNEGKVIVVAGFQGTSGGTGSRLGGGDLEITTLGRGGSDTSAVALAAAMQAERCEIYTDVPGILTADPRIVPDAQLMDEITCDEMLELASLGASVLHPRAVEIARNYGIPLVVRSSWTDQPGTRVTGPMPQPRALEGLEIAHPVDAVEFDADQAKVALLRVPDRPGVAARLFGELADQSLNVDLVIQSIHEGNSNDIAFTVRSHVLNQAESVAEHIAPILRSQPNATDEAEVRSSGNIAKISIAGAGMIGRPGVAAGMFSALAAANVNIQMIATSEVKVSCTVAQSDCDRAIATLCEHFDVSSSPARIEQNQVDLANLRSVRGAALDLEQSQLAIRYVPDKPGLAAKIFQILADRGISVDMIIQSQRSRLCRGQMTRDIACTVAQADADLAKDVLQTAAAELNCGEVMVDHAIAKVSIVGIGMIHRPGIAAAMFKALSAANINIQMIATSEIKISCVVAQDKGIQALKVVHAAFDLAANEVVELLV
ncbi:asparate kinase, monofunctional class, putative [Synechococcus sp. PCC 7335]|uniref:aspartate kinase n=1 Tax=Synechococcus sp. (strain ATCC 29403 / PCC 7335) TaxID=91464 RepID=UPI00017EE816|nr:aspartate kinase [Synechococcus sp. PCC 7335]EDX87823.1 asparate kinase, monofunctional class, putative [Synechococcus sp. PCC 7335]